MQHKIHNSLGFLRTTAIGGVLFLLPFVVVMVLLVYVYQSVVAVHDRLKSWIPFDSVTRIGLLFALAILLLLAACFLAGLLARRAFGLHFSGTLERQLMKVFPKYGIYKDLLAGTIGGDEAAPSLRPVLVKREEELALAFEADRLANGLVVVYFPGSPDTWNGSIALIAPGNVQSTDVPFAEVLRICERLGRESSSHFRAVSRDEVAPPRR